MTTSASVEADMSLEEITVASDCPEIVQDDPETWLECILNLEDAGNEEAAEREREALIDTFPDFKIP
jgi:predicted GTPase